jgi:AcrR family transcriptional regulator
MKRLSRCQSPAAKAAGLGAVPKGGCSVDFAQKVLYRVATSMDRRRISGSALKPCRASVLFFDIAGPADACSTNRRGIMPAKAVTRKLQPVIRGQHSHIPTTIKNPERVAHRRAELIEVATKMFLERGFHNTSIRDIVRACSFNVASLYMYVSSKEDILYLVAQDLMNNIAQKLAETKLDHASPKRSLEIGFSSYCEIANRFRRPIRLLYREVGFLPPEPRAKVIATVSGVITYFENIIAQGIAAGVFRNVPARLAGLDVMCIAHMIALHTREVRAFGDLDAYINYQLDSIFAGLLAAPEKRRAAGWARPRLAAVRSKPAKRTRKR